jgi:hypothetical protein
MAKAIAVERIARPANPAIKPNLSARDPIAYAAAAKALG